MDKAEPITQFPFKKWIPQIQIRKAEVNGRYGDVK
jgi:hypothetical protein